VVNRSLITLRALSYGPTGGIVAAPTTSLPEQLGGPRNWDYRCCWLRDATFTLQALIASGYIDEAQDWRDWLLRAIAGLPAQVQVLYGVAGERQLLEWQVPWLPGYEARRRYASAMPPRPASARRLWRGHGRAAPGGQSRAGLERRRLAAAARAGRSPRDHLATAR